MAEDRESNESRTTLSDRLFGALLRHRVVAMLLLVCVTVGLAAGLPRLEFDNSYEMWFVDDDPALVAYRDFLEQFGSDEALVLLVDTAGDPFSTDTLRIVEAISSRLLDHSEVSGVWSLTRTRAMLRDEAGTPEVRPLLRPVPTPREVDQARVLLASSSLYGLLLPDEAGPTAILLRLESTGRSFEPKARLVRDTRRIARELGEGRDTWLAGSAAVDEALFRYSERDTSVFAPILLFALLAVLGLLFRNVVCVLLPIVTVAASLVWALGFMGWMGWRVNIVTTVLPPLLIAVGIADSVHLLQEFRTQMARTSRGDSLRRAFRAVLRPCLLTTLTTAAGMASLLVASLAGIREMGVTAAVGVVAAFLLTMIGLTIALGSVPERWLHGLRRQRARPQSRLAPLSRISSRHPRAVLLAAAVVLAASILGLGRLEVGSSMASYFHEDDPLYQEMLTVDGAFGGTFPFEVLVEATGETSLLEPDSLRRVDEIARYLETLPGTGTAYSHVDFLVEVRRAWAGGSPGDAGIPASREEAVLAAQLLGDDEDFARFLTPGHRSARIEVGVQGGRYQELVDRLPAVEDRIRVLAAPVARTSVTGLGRLVAAMEQYLLSSQIWSFGLAFGLVTVLIGVFFLSWRVGLLSGFLNLLPILLVLGLMGWFAITLDVTTIMLAPLLLGLVVDDTVHMLERALGARQQGASIERAFDIAVEQVGAAIAITSVVLTAGFITMVFGVFLPNVHFGALAVVAIGWALVGDLVVLPAAAGVAPALLPGGTPGDRYGAKHDSHGSAPSEDRRGRKP